MSGLLKATVLADLTSEINEMRVNEEINSKDDEFEEKFNPDMPPTELPSIVDEIDIIYEETDYHNNIGSSDCGSNDKVDGKDLGQVFLDILNCDRGCVTCAKYMQILSAHVRTTHDPPPFIFIKDPELIHLLHVDPDLSGTLESSSTGIGIKSDPVEIVEKMECLEDEREINNELSDPKEFESESVNDPDYTPPASPRLSQNVHRQGLTKNTGSSESKRYKTKKRNLSSQELKCDVCDKSCTTRSNLMAHRRIHAENKRFKCMECDKSFTRSNHLTVHERSHSGERPYACTECDKTFRRKDYMIAHMGAHSGETPFKCDVCGKGLLRLAHLNDHKRSHTGERPFTCEVCGRSFKVNSYLTIHKRTHTGEAPCKCTVCEESFKSPSHLNYHRKNKH